MYACGEHHWLTQVDASLFPPNSTNYQNRGFSCDVTQGCLFYFSPQTLGNNFFTLGKNSKFREKRKKKKIIIIMKKKKKKKKKKSKDTKIICREGFVEILHFEGGRILPSGGKG